MERKFLLAGIILCLSPSVRAQPAPALPAGWSETQTPTGQIYKSDAEGAMVVVLRTEAKAVSSPSFGRGALENVDGCKGITAVAETALHNGRIRKFSSQGQLDCAVFIGTTGALGIVTIAISPRQSGAGAAALGEALVSRLLGQSPGNSVNPSQIRDQQARTVAASPLASDAALRLALDSVPLANRPIAMPTRQEGRSSGGVTYQVYMPWLVFANGYATDSDCYDWDPRKLAPTPQSLGSAGKRCEVVKWRKVGKDYQFMEEDGSWDTRSNGAVLYPFTPGLRLDRILENEGGTGSASVTGMISVNTVFRGGLTLSTAGFMQSKWSNDTGISGGGFGGGTSGSGSSLAGRYYASGFLIAVLDANAQVKIGFIAGANDETKRRYHRIYLNGQQYWPSDK